MRANEILGDHAEMVAAAWFRAEGYLVSLVWGQGPYDLVVDDGSDRYRVEVKATTRRGHTERGGKEWGWIAIADARKPFDLLYVHTPDIHYVIPRTALGDTRRGLTVPSADDIDAGTESKWLAYATDDVLLRGRVATMRSPTTGG